MKRRNLAAMVAAATAVAVIPAAGAMAASAKHDGRTVLPNSGTPSAQGLSMKSAAASSKQMSFTLQLPMRNAELADSLVARGVVLSQAQYRAYFSPSQASVKKVTDWAKSQGFSVTHTSRISGQVSVRSDVAHVNKAFKVSMKNATLDGVRGLAVNKAPSVPASVGVSGVAGLNSVHRMTTHDHAMPNSKRPTPRPASSNNHRMRTGGVAKGGQLRGAPRNVKPHDGDVLENCTGYWGTSVTPSAHVFQKESDPICGYLPGDLSKMYKAGSADSKKPAIGILLWGNNPNMKAETNTYMTNPKVGYPKLTKYHTKVAKPDSNMPNCDPQGVQTEQAIDVQSSHAIAPNSPIYYYGAASCYDDALTSMLQTAVDAHKVSTISMSFGTYSDKGMTKSDMNAWDRPLRQAALTGISVFASTGDDGDNSFVTDDGKKHVGYPATSEYLSAVGATSVGMKANGKLTVQAGWENGFYQQPDLNSKKHTDVTDEMANTVIGGSKFGYHGAGGGVSAVSKRPTWQKGVVSYKGSKRAVPDVAAVGNPYTGYTIYNYDGQYYTYGGTSLASPVIAAASALAKAKSGVKLGNLAPKFYALSGSSAIKDVNLAKKSGLYFPTNYFNLIAFDSKPQSLVTKKGWDNVTGVGVPGGKAFYTAFK